MSNGFAIGKQLGNYQITRLLGEGGFAQVYLGEHIYLGTQAAIKVLSAQAGNDLDWFLKEARTIARLVHPNIVRVLEFGVEEGSLPYLVMDYAPNGTLRQRHAQGEQLPLSSIVSYAKQVAEALQYAHDQKLVHRDVKPENMLLGRNNEVLLGDFGIAMMAQTMLKSVQNVAGTVPYMAPEQLQGQSRRASDQYSLGVSVYEWLVGERPFRGSLTELISQQIAVPPPSLLAKRPTLPPAVEQVVMTALEKDPDRRFGNVRAFAQALEQASQLAMGTAEPASARMDSSGVSVPSFEKQPVASPPNNVAPTQLPPVSPAIQDKPAGSVVCSYREYANTVRSLAWLPDSRRIISVSGDKTLHVWDALTGNRLQSYQDAADAVYVVAASRDSAHFATAGSDGLVRVWDIAASRVLCTYRGHAGNSVNTLTWSPAQPLLASAASDGAVHVWDARTGQPLTIYRGHTASVNMLAWSPQELALPRGRGYHIVSAGDDTSVQTWEASTGKNVALYRGQPAKVRGVAWSPAIYVAPPQAGYTANAANNSSRVGCGREDGLVQMWDTVTDREVLSYRYQAPISVVAWSPDGRRFAYASENKMLEVWDTSTNMKLFTFSHTAPTRVMAWSPDGKYIASGGGDATIQVRVAP